MEQKIDITDMLSECREMWAFLDEKTDSDVAVIYERMRELQGIISRSAQMFADAKYVQDTQRTALFAEYSKEIGKMSPTIAKMFIDSQNAEVNYLVVQTEKIYKISSRFYEGSRSILSNEREMARLNKSGY